MKLVAGYIRVSTPGQAKDGESLNTQEDEIRHFIKGKKGWKLTHIYKDEGISGSKTKNRPGFMQMISDADQGKFQGIVFSKLSRFARNAGDFLHFRDTLKEKGVQLFSIKENIDHSTHTGKLMIGLMALIAEWERENIREQMSDNKIVKWREKRTFIGQPPYGYKWDKDNNKIALVEDEARIYKRIVEMYLNLNKSFQSIAGQLKDEGIKGKRKDFKSATISGILKNPAYYGHYVVNKNVYGDGDRGAGTVRTGELKPESKHITFELPPLISKTDWDRIQEKTKANTKRVGRPSPFQKKYWLRDILKCEYCGGRMKHHYGAKRKDGTFPRYYSCYWSSASNQTLKLHNKKKCPMPFIKAEELEKDIWINLMAPLYIHPDHLSPLVDPVKYNKEIEDLNVQTNRQERNLKKKQTKRKHIYEILEEDDYDKDELSNMLNKNKDEILKIEAQLSETKQRLQEMKEAKENDQLLKQFVCNKPKLLSKLVNDLKRLSLEDKKMFAESLIDGNITVGFDHEYGNKYLDPEFKTRFNMTIFEDLMKQGKIGRNSKYSSDNTARDDL